MAVNNYIKKEDLKSIAGFSTLKNCRKKEKIKPKECKNQEIILKVRDQ